jgi:hypothetical protein
MFDFYDALTFRSIGYECHHNGIATLAGILLSMDGMDRTTLPRQELEKSLNKLTASGYIAMAGEDYSLTLEGKAVYDGTPQLPGQRIGIVIHNVQQKLAKKDSISERFYVIEITEKKYRRALKDAQKLFNSL